MSTLREQYLPRDGTSQLRAILVTSVAEEYAWLRDHYPGYRFKYQDHPATENCPYDLLTIEEASGVQRQVWFRVSASSAAGQGFGPNARA